jgi:glycosyltransferase involved in cell wall biosynthesis
LKKLLIVAPYSHPSKCGIWKRVTDDIKEISGDKNYKIEVFSSNILKGTKEILPKKENWNGVQILRFKSWFSLGANSLFFFHFFKLIKANPDIIHTHGYRHPHSIQALIIGKLMRKKVILTAHAPFNKDPRRSILIKFFDKAYDLLIGWWEIRLYNTIILTTKWERKFLEKLGAKDKNILYIPNGVDPKFITTIPAIDQDRKIDVIYVGRLDPVKRLEWIKESAKSLSNYNFKILGPLSGYDSFESESDNLIIDKTAYEFEDFINLAQNSKIYVLPSARESFGMTMIEAMSQGCIVISSDTDGARNIIKNGENGFVVNNQDELTNKIRKVLENYGDYKNLIHNAIDTSRDFSSERTSEDMKEFYGNMAKGPELRTES